MGASQEAAFVLQTSLLNETILKLSWGPAWLLTFECYLLTLFFFFGRKNLESYCLSDFKKYLMNSLFTPREKEGNEKQSRIFFLNLCLILVW